MDLHKLFYFTGKCLTLDENPSRRDVIAGGLFSGDIPINDFIYFCDAHLALTSVYFKLKKHDLIKLLPPELQEHLEYVYSVNKKRNNEITGQVEEINAALHKEGIQPVYLKGAAFLLDSLYEDAGERIMADIDFLVEETNCSEAARLLEDLGYKPLWLYYGDVLECKVGFAPEHHFPLLLREDVPAAVELHRMPASPRYSRRFTANMVLSRKQQITDRQNCFVPCDEDKMVHNFIHAQIANSGYRMKSTLFRDIYDLYLISKRVNPESTLPQIEERDKASGYFLFAAAALGLGSTLYTTNNKKAIRHCALNDLALKHPRISKIYRKFIKLARLIFKAYLPGIITAIYRKSARQHIMQRIKDPRWFKAHAIFLKHRFWD